MDGNRAWVDQCSGTMAVVEACKVVVCNLQAHAHWACLALAFCDNLATATALAHNKLTHKAGRLTDHTVCDFQELSEQQPLLMGWSLAQHDTSMRSMLALLNQRANAAAKRVGKHKTRRTWAMPKAWSDGHTFAWYMKGKRVMGTKQAVRANMLHTQTTRYPRHKGHVPMAHISSTCEDKHLRQLWRRCRFRHPREQARALLATGEEGQGACNMCSVTYDCKIQHAHLQCPRLWANVPTGLAMIAHLCREQVKPGVRVQYVCGGTTDSRQGGRGTTDVDAP